VKQNPPTPELREHLDLDQLKRRLADLISAREETQVRAMLERRPELANMAMSYGDERRPLHYAVLNRAPEMVRLLMRLGADARRGVHPHRDATTALTIATERGYGEIVTIIEEEEQRRRQAMSASGVTPTTAQDELSSALADGDDALAMSMLEADPTLVHGCDRDGWTPLHLASAKRNPVLVAWLLAHGAAPNRHGKDDRTPLDMAASARGSLRAEDFAQVADLLRQAGAELTPRAAAALGNEAWLRARHAEGTLVNPITWEAGGLFTIAVKHNQAEIIELLLSFGFDPDERASYGDGAGIVYSQCFALWHCAALGRREMAETLLRHGATLNAHVDSSGTPVHSAYSHRQWEMVELFRRYGGVVGADTLAIYRQTDLVRQMLADEDRGELAEGTVSSGRTLAEDLLDFASSGGDPEIVRLALARIHWPRSDPRWFFFLVRSLDFWNHIPWLYASNPKLDRTTYLACFRKVLARCDPNLIGSFGRTALHEVAAMGDHVTDDEAAEFAITLLDAGARTDVRDDILNSTPLAWACRWGRLKVAKVLLDRGADSLELDAEPWARPKAWAEKMHRADIAALLAR
jgi:ankyrin repeat protein